jgi:hypothetical protein
MAAMNLYLVRNGFGASHCIESVDLTAAIVRAKGARRRRLPEIFRTDATRE